MKKILDKRNMTEQDWQDYRRKQRGLGGSDVATILGLNPWKSAFTLWLEKTGQIEPPEVKNEYVEWGNLLEPVIREKFARETGFEVRENPYVLQHDEFEFMVANIDGECFDPEMGEWGVLEIKTTSERNKDEWIDGPPNHYHLQIQHYMATMEYNYAYVACLIGGHSFVFFKIDRDDYIIDKIISAEKEFTQLVEGKIAPEISSHSMDADYLNTTYPNANDEIGELTADDEAFALRYTEIQKQIKGLAEEADYIKNRIKLKAKEYKALQGPTYKVSMPTVKKITFDSKQFAVDYPELYEKYKTKETSYRNFTVSEIRRN